MRGYACIGLDNPKNGENIGGVMRAAGCYGIGLIVISGPRFKTIKRFPTDTMRVWKHIPLIETDNILNVIPLDCVPVAVDLIDAARPLPGYTHPERAFYIFGAEDATLGKRITDKCRDIVMVPTTHCMNLAATANVVLYDRMCKNNG